MTPGQRLRMLKELIALNAQPGEAKIEDQELMRKMSPAEIHRDLNQSDRDTAAR